MSNPVHALSQFLHRYQLHDQPLLLALSGGPDSLCLFYSLLSCRRVFHVAHIDHGWRVESHNEAHILKELVTSYGIPFHEKKLDPEQLKGNLENACRQERLQFFATLCRQHRLQGVLLGHHRDDQAETILKRLLEGSDWSHFTGLKPDMEIHGVRLLRPFLSLSKQEITLWLEQHGKSPFEDPTNEDPRFLRGRMRQSLIPELNQGFGKDIRSALVYIGEEMQDLKEYFDQRLAPLLNQVQRGPLGAYLDVQTVALESVEMKYLIRRFCREEGCLLSRQQISLAQQWLQNGTADRLLEVGVYQVWIDRRRIFILSQSNLHKPWKWMWRECNDRSSCKNSSWQSGWKEGFRAYLPQGEYHLALAEAHQTYQYINRSIGKWWTDHKVPAFLRRSVPVIWRGSSIYHEFLTGKNFTPYSSSEKWGELVIHSSPKNFAV